MSDEITPADDVAAVESHLDEQPVEAAQSIEADQPVEIEQTLEQPVGQVPDDGTPDEPQRVYSHEPSPSTVSTSLIISESQQESHSASGQVTNNPTTTDKEKLTYWSLPRELRDEIWEYALRDARAVVLFTSPRRSLRECLRDQGACHRPVTLRPHVVRAINDESKCTAERIQGPHGSKTYKFNRLLLRDLSPTPVTNFDPKHDWLCVDTGAGDRNPFGSMLLNAQSNLGYSAEEMANLAQNVAFILQENSFLHSVRRVGTCLRLLNLFPEVKHVAVISHIITLHIEREEAWAAGLFHYGDTHALVDLHDTVRMQKFHAFFLQRTADLNLPLVKDIRRIWDELVDQADPSVTAGKEATPPGSDLDASPSKQQVERQAHRQLITRHRAPSNRSQSKEVPRECSERTKQWLMALPQRLSQSPCGGYRDDFDSWSEKDMYRDEDTEDVGDGSDTDASPVTAATGGVGGAANMDVGGEKEDDVPGIPDVAVSHTNEVVVGLVEIHDSSSASPIHGSTSSKNGELSEDYSSDGIGPPSIPISHRNGPSVLDRLPYMTPFVLFRVCGSGWATNQQGHKCYHWRRRGELGFNRQLKSTGQAASFAGN